MRRPISVTLESKLTSMDAGEELAREAARSAGLDEEEQYRVSLAVRECLINAYQHGNKSDESKHIELEILHASDEIVFVVTDEGEGFDAQGVPDPREDERLLAHSGRGIFLMRTFMDAVEVGPAESGGTKVRMTKKVSYANLTAGPGPEKENQT